MQKNRTAAWRILIVLTLFLLPAVQVSAQWEPTGSIQREIPSDAPVMKNSRMPPPKPKIVTGTPRRVAADANGLAVIADEKTLWRYDGKAWAWVKLPDDWPYRMQETGFFLDVAVYDSKVYVAGPFGGIYVASEAAGWQKLTGGGAKYLATDNKGQLWMVGIKGSVNVYNNESWTGYGSVLAKDIAAYNGTPVIVSQEKGNVLVGKDGKWWHLGEPMENASNVAIDHTTGTVWVTAANGVWAYTASGWKKYAEKAEYRDISAFSGTPYTLQNGGIVKGVSTDAQWRTAGRLVGTSPFVEPTPEPAKTVAITPATTVSVSTQAVVAAKASATPATAITAVTAPASAIQVTTTPAAVTSTVTPAAVAAAPSGPYLRTAKSTYQTSEDIEVEFGNFEGSSFDWIALVEKEKPDDTWGTYKYTSGKTSGKVAFSSAWAGTYELRGFFNNGKEVKARVTVVIE